MADNNGTVIDPRYMTYNKDEVEALLDKVNNADAEPKEDSANMISSGAVAAALEGYNTKDEIAELTKVSSEEAVRGIVQNWTPEGDSSSSSDSSSSV